MSQERPTLENLRDDILNGRVNRRDVLRRALALGLSAPVIAGLLAACGDDDDDDGGDDTEATEPESDGGAATEAEEEPTAAEEEPTEAEGGATGTEAEGEATAEGDATGTEAEGDATAEGTESDSGSAGGEQTIEGGDRLMGKEIEEAASEGGILIEGAISDISTLSPVMSSDVPSSDVQGLIFESLMEANPDTLEPVGLLAESWSVNADGTVWTVMLREGIVWHDGEVFDAEDVKFTYDLHMTEETNSPRFSDFTSKIESVEIVDPQTITFTLLNPLADFPLDLGVYGIIAEHIWADVAPADHQNDPGATGQDPARVVGTGPFTFGEWIVEDRVVVNKYAEYWDGEPHLDQYIWRYLGDQTAVLQALQTGDIDWGGVPEAQVAQLDGTDVGVINYPTISFTFYGTNLDTEKTTLFQDVELRQAMLYALDREAMIEAIRFGFGQVAIGTMPVISWAYNPDGIDESNLYPYDVDMANQLLDDSGWAMGDDGVRAKDGTRLAFTMYTNAGNEVRESYLTTLQEFWREVGIEMTPQLEPFPALVERITETFDFEVFLIGFNWSATPGQEAMWACDSYPLGFNIVKYCNPEVDEVMLAAAGSTDQEERIELYTQMQNLVLADLPMPVLDFPEGIVGLNNRVHNVFANSVNERFNPETWWIES